MLVILASCDLWDEYGKCLNLLIKVITEDGRSVAAMNALLKYTKKMSEEGQIESAIQFAYKGFEIGEIKDVLVLLMYIEYLRAGE